MQLSSLSLALTAIYGPGFAWRNFFADGTPGFRINVEEALRLNQQAMGPELIVNGDGSSLAGWTQGNTGASFWSASGGRFVATTNGTDNARLRQVIPTLPGRSYVVSYIATGGGSYSIGTVAGGSELLGFGTGVRIFSATTTEAHFNYITSNNGTTLDNVSIREIDLSKCVAFQDSAGTLPVVSKEQPLGLIFDTKLGVPVRGPELVTGDSANFSGGIGGWVKSGVAIVSASAGVAQVTGGANYADKAELIVSGSANKAVLFEADVWVSGGTARVALRGTDSPFPEKAFALLTNTTPTRIRLIALPETANLLVQIVPWSGNASQVVYFDNISVRELPGNHFVQPSNTASRPIVSRRVNLLTATATLATQSVTTLAASHVLTISGTGSVTLSGTATGTYSAGTHTITTTAGTLTVTVSGSVTNADLRLSSDVPGLPSYQRVTSSTDYDEVGFPAYARADGLDDWLESGVVDMSSTDAVTVIAGVTKLSDAAAGVVLELGPTTAITNGTFRMSAVPNRYVFASKGSSAEVNAEPVGSPYPAPHKGLLVGTSKISTDTAILRVNGTQVATNGADQGTGNYGAHKFFLMRRAGTSLPFNGRLYGVTVIGKLLTDSQLAAAEQAERQLGRLY